MKTIENIISFALIGGGAAGLAIASKPLMGNTETDIPLNVLGINRSPYGEVFAMAMQEPIDEFFHAVEDRGHTCNDGGHCQHGHAKPEAQDGKGLRHFIDGMSAGLAERTNPKAATAGHKFFIRRGIEDKLRFAYNLDPAHYGNYNAYHFFLTEPELGTRPQLTPTAAKLAHETISYCLAQQSDPRQALTAAAAAENVVELMFNDRHLHPEKPNFTTDQMRELVEVTDRAIGLYSHLSNQWSEDGLWSNLSDLRRAEVEDRLGFILRIRQSQEQAIRRLEGLPDERRASAEIRSDWESLNN